MEIAIWIRTLVISTNSKALLGRKKEICEVLKDFQAFKASAGSLAIQALLDRLAHKDRQVHRASAVQLARVVQPDR